jgi:hypothetical protein
MFAGVSVYVACPGASTEQLKPDQLKPDQLKPDQHCQRSDNLEHNHHDEKEAVEKSEEGSDLGRPGCHRYEYDERISHDLLEIQEGEEEYRSRRPEREYGNHHHNHNHEKDAQEEESGSRLRGTRDSGRKFYYDNQ